MTRVGEESRTECERQERGTSFKDTAAKESSYILVASGVKVSRDILQDCGQRCPLSSQTHVGPGVVWDRAASDLPRH